MVDLKAKPYYLSDEDIKWVEDTIAGMSKEEKTGQLFVNMVQSRKPEDMEVVISKYHPGALRYMNAPAEELYEQNKYFQEHSKVPLLIACNCEAGGNGGVGGGTAIGCGAAVAAADSIDMVKQVAEVGAKEAKAIGSNWNFAPIVDILDNWRNTVVQMRAYNNNPDDIIRYSKAFNDVTKEQGLVSCAKHFPGDGLEENDQHLMMGLNDISCEEWDKTFGKVYKELIDNGVMSIMAGHIAQPAWQRAIAKKEVPDSEILPATLCPELITGLLREKMGFNGLVVTDASHMIGMMGAMSREKQVPSAIAAGCDMFLFFNDYDEDFQYMLKAYESGFITEERMQDALHRILGLKAAIGLHKKQAEGTLMPPKSGLSVVGCEEHHKIAAHWADKYVTLVKDTQALLPIDPAKKKKMRLIFIGGGNSVVAGKVLASNSGKIKQELLDRLGQAGFEVTLVEGDKFQLKGKMTDLKKDCDVILVAMDIVGFCQHNAIRLEWQLPAMQPYYVSEVPTIFASFNLTNHLIDLTMSHTYVNAYMDSNEAIQAFVDKITGKSPFLGRFNDNVWCDRWDTKL